LEDVDPTGQTVIFWYQHTRERENALKALMQQFNQANPHRIKTIGEYAGGYDDIYNKMIVGIQSGTVPNLVVAYQNQAMAYALAGGLVHL
jgi:multiple sugar transport system substrate-binding protein/sn-glycerol 3-phosphate transport system substrate-binding protein